MFTILAKSNKTFRGPFTDNPAPANGETRIVISEEQKSQRETLLSSPNPQNRIVLYDSGTFRLATLDESAAASPTLRWALIYLFLQITSAVDRAKLYPLYFTMSGMFDTWGDNCERNPQAKADMKTMIGDALADEDNADLTAIQTKMLVLTQWN